MPNLEQDRQINRTIWWIVGALFAILVLLSSALVSAAETRSVDAGRSISQLSERVAVTESQQKSTEKRLDSIDTKLDKIIELQTHIQQPGRGGS